MNQDKPSGQAVTLVIRRTIQASAARLFEAWTRPEHLERWWGPSQMRCAGVEVDLRVGGRYRIGNHAPDGRVVWIVGEFEQIAPPHRLVYTWRLEPGAGDLERVTVRFEPREGATEVIVIHERVTTPASRDLHEQGWRDCLDGLIAFLEGTR